ncbi:MAG: epimerase [Planctomycetales bacterium]
MTTCAESKRVVIAGGSGFLGVSLATHLTAAGWSVVVLSRRPPKPSGPWRHVSWDARTLGGWRQELDGANGLINLAGRSVDCLKTPDHQDEILRSRVEATRVLGLALRAVDRPPPVWVQMSTAHIYGDPPQVVCTEGSPLGYGLAPFVGREWEEAFHASALSSQRQVVLRTGFVLGRDRGAGGGALARLQLPVRLGLGGRIGSGTQGMSWIHELDLNRLFERALTDVTMQGAYIASSPNPVPQQTFMRILRRALGMPIGLPAPAWIVRWGVRWLLRTDPELALYGRFVVSQRLLEASFEWRLPSLEEALDDLLRRRAYAAEVVFPGSLLNNDKQCARSSRLPNLQRPTLHASPHGRSLLAGRRSFRLDAYHQPHCQSR